MGRDVQINAQLVNVRAPPSATYKESQIGHGESGSGQLFTPYIRRERKLGPFIPQGKWLETGPVNACRTDVIRYFR